MDRLLASPLAMLAGLAVLNLAARFLLLRRLRSPLAAGAAIMAVGIFALAALQQLPAPHAALTRLLALQLSVNWAGLAVAYALAARGRREPLFQRDNRVQRFALGTWVAATAVLAEVILAGVPAWRPVALLLLVLAVLIWLCFLPLVVAGHRHLFTAGERAHPTGVILLSTVSTQALVLTAHDLYHTTLPAGIAAPFIVAGAVLYAGGVWLILARYRRLGRAQLLPAWDNTNCILHGAASITGLAIITTGALPRPWAIPVWLWAAVALVLVEGVEALRARARIARYGWRRGLLNYHVSQWARNFTFGMFYAFTLTLAGAPDAFSAGGWSRLRLVQAAVLAGGQYVVLALLVVEVALFLWDNAEMAGRPASRREAGEAR